MKDRQAPWWKYGVVPFTLLIAYLLTPQTELRSGYDSDGSYYALMAGATDSALEGTSVKAPWVLRPVVPMVAGRLPFDLTLNFLLISFLANCGTLYFLYRILLKFQPSKCVAVWGISFYATVFWTVQFSRFSPFYIDATVQLFWLMSLFFLLHHEWRGVLLSLLVGVLVKESLLVLAVFAAIYTLTQKEYRSVWPFWQRLSFSLALIGLPLTVWHGVSLLLAVEPSSSLLDTWLRHVSSYLESWKYPVLLVAASFSGTGILLGWSIFLGKKTLPWLLSHPIWILYLLMTIAMLFGGSDKSRLFLYLLPLLCILLALTLYHLKDRMNRLTLSWVTGLLFGAHLFISGTGWAMCSPDLYIAKLLPEQATGSFLLHFGLNLGVFSLTLAIIAWLMRAAPSSPSNQI